MPGRPKMRARKAAMEAMVNAAALLAAGDPSAAEAVAEAGRMAEAVKANLLPIDPPGDTEKVRKEVADYVSELIDRLPVQETAPLPTVAVFTPIAAPTGSLEPLTDAEFSVAASVVSACAGDGFNPPDPEDGDIRFLAAAFPSLTAVERVRAARYLSAMANEALRPIKGTHRSAASDLAMGAAGITYTAFEAMRKRDYRFDNACETIIAARRTALMNMLEEELMERAFEGGIEEKATLGGAVVKLRKFDNKLAFDILRFNHLHYVKTAKSTAKAGSGGGKGSGGMTLIVGGRGGGDVASEPSVRMLKPGGRG